MKKFKVLAFFLLALFPFSSFAASSLTLSPPGGTVKAGETFKVMVFADPNGAALDTVRARINFPTEMLEAQSFSLNSSFNYQAGGNDLGNQTGQFSWGSGAAGGILQSSVFGTIVFKAKKEGRAAISVSPDSLVLSSGENSFDGNSSSAVYQISPSLVTPPVQPKPSQQTPKTAPEPKTQQPQATSTPLEEDSFLGQSDGLETQESIFPGLTADLSAGVLPFVEEPDEKEEQPLFSRTNKIILAGMIIALLLIGWAIFRLKDSEIRV